jgi:hypothetical protein
MRSEPRVTLPTFLVIGAYKSGTTALDRYLRAHPNVYLPAVKEPDYYAFRGARPGTAVAGRPVPSTAVTDRIRYRALFDHAAGEHAIGEVSPEYLVHPDAAAAIADELPGVKLIAVLRNPIERAYSDYLMYVRDGREPLDFAAALAVQGQRAREADPRGHYVDTGFYGKQLRRYYERFEAARLRVYLFDDLASDPTALLRDLFGFLGVDPGFVPPDLGEHNVSGVPRSHVHKALLRARARLGPSLKRFVPPALGAKVDRRLRSGLDRPPLPDDARAQLRRLYQDDVAELAALIGRDLRSWTDDA